MTTRTNQVSNETLLARRPTLTSREPILFSLLLIDFVVFASGAIAHMGIPIPLGFGTWNETFLVPATLVEDVAGAALFLASDDAAWITGIILDISGGAVMV